MLRMEHVHKYFGRTQALRDVNIELEPGVVTGLLGENGSGKSTLLKIAAGLQYPNRGRVFINNHPVGLATKALTAYSPENNSFPRWMQIRQVVDYANLFFTDFQVARAEELIKFMGLDPSSRINTLSKGMVARLKLVVSLARDASLLLLDEPFSGIDPVSRKRILDALIDQLSRTQQTVLLSTHEISEAEGLFERVLIMSKGQSVLEGEADRLRQERGCTIEDLLAEVMEQ